MLVIAIITASMLNTVHTGSTPTVLAPTANAAVVFDRPAPAPAKSSTPAKPIETKSTRGVAYSPGPSICYGYNLSADPKHEAIAGSGVSQIWCDIHPPVVP